jgi:mannose-1-phosphate guanylyltransferase/phosphomannomutase
MRNQQITKGMILGAGLGTRLLPITERYPKPLVPVLNLANVLHTIALLKRHGIQEIVMNLFHLPERIEEFMKDLNIKDVSLYFSKESTLLGTGGGVKKAESLLGKNPFVLANCDFISNLNLSSVIQQHFSKNAWATMALLNDPERQKLYSPVGVDENSCVCSLPRKRISEPAREGIFTGVHVLGPEVFSFLEEKPSGINEVLYPSLMDTNPEKALGCFVDDAFWFDTGDIPALWQSSMSLLDLISDPSSCLLNSMSSFGPVYKESAPGIWTTQRTQIPAHVKIQGPVVLGEGCRLEEGVEIGPYSVVGDKVAIEKNSKIRSAVLLSFSHIPQDAVIENCVFFEERALSARSPQT